MQFPLLTAPLSWQGPMHFHYRNSKITITIIAISILSLSTTDHMKLLCSSTLHSTLAHAKYLGQKAQSRRIIAVFVEYHLSCTLYQKI